MNKLFFIIGASGSGKTTALKNIENTISNNFQCLYFDSIGVPSEEKMIKDFSSVENWQKIYIRKWIKTIKEEYLSKKSVILDGQMRPSFIEESCFENNIVDYKVVLFDCSDIERKKRLTERGQAELGNEQMMSWAKYLREESESMGYKIIDNTNLNQEQSKEILIKILNE